MQIEWSVLLQSIRYESELFLACLIYLLPLAKRSHWQLRGALISAALLLCSAVLTPPGLSWIWVAVKFIIEFFYAALLVFSCCAITKYDAIYCASCAYATQHFASSLDSLCRSLMGGHSEIASTLLCFCIYGCTYLLFYFLFALRLPQDGHYNASFGRSTSSVLFIIPFAVVINLVVDIFHAPDDLTVYAMCKLYAMLCCFFVLWGQSGMQKAVQMKAGMEIERQLWRKQKAQYDLSRRNIDLINRKCHDLKHQIAALRSGCSESSREKSLVEIERAVMLYDGISRTGNEALDTVLTEKSLICQEQQITWTCMADGRRLSFMDPVDLYTLFGNALDNAIEAVSKIQTPEKRIIAVNLFTKGDLLMLQIENYYTGSLQFKNGLPQTTKGNTDDHGFGMQSIRSTAEKYGGSITVHPENEIFLLRILIPLP
ncbi:MAG: ATP-binding protein [Candidatus Onthomonas sp.]